MNYLALNETNRAKIQVLEFLQMKYKDTSSMEQGTPVDSTAIDSSFLGVVHLIESCTGSLQKIKTLTSKGKFPNISSYQMFVKEMETLDRRLMSLNRTFRELVSDQRHVSYVSPESMDLYRAAYTGFSGVFDQLNVNEVGRDSSGNRVVFPSVFGDDRYQYTSATTTNLHSLSPYERMTLRNLSAQVRGGYMELERTHMIVEQSYNFSRP